MYGRRIISLSDPDLLSFHSIYYIYVRQYSMRPWETRNKKQRHKSEGTKIKKHKKKLMEVLYGRFKFIVGKEWWRMEKSAHFTMKLMSSGWLLSLSCVLNLSWSTIVPFDSAMTLIGIISEACFLKLLTKKKLKAKSSQWCNWASLQLDN